MPSFGDGLCLRGANLSNAPAGGYVRWALYLEFDGTGYVGWQRQNNGASIQSCLEQAGSAFCGGAPVMSATSGRTDAGVHASAMIVQLDLPQDRPTTHYQLRDGLNFHLKPHLIGVTAARRAPPGWHARFSAIGRCYRYTILNRATRPILDANRVWHIKHPLNVGNMQEASSYLIGRHDFSSFRAASCQASSPVRTLNDITIVASGAHILIEVQARSFLHHQVRNIAGSLALVGRGKWTPAFFRDVLLARDRTRAGPTAPPEGLCLIRVNYPENLFESE